MTMQYWATEYVKTAEVTIGRPWFNPIADTVGRIFGTHTGSLSDEEIRDIADKMGVKDVHVSVGGSEPIRELIHHWKNPEQSLKEKLRGTALIPWYAYRQSVARTDYASPATNTVVSYGNDPAVLAHEFGHIKETNFDQDVVSQERAATNRARAAGYWSPRLADGLFSYLRSS